MLPASASTLRLKKQPLGLTKQAGIGNCDAHARGKPSHVDSVAIYGLALVGTCLVLLPLGLALDDLIPLQLLAGKLGTIIAIVAVASTLAMILFIYLIATTGPVFASQSAYATTAAGIGWSVVLLGEHIPLWTWAALGLIIVGLIMVALGRLGDAIADADNGN
jgi:drug/metabolite transporter (DMT)-like permease